MHPRYIGIGSLYSKDFHFWIRYLKNRKHEKEEPHLIDPENDVLLIPPPPTIDEEIYKLNEKKKFVEKNNENIFKLIALKETKRMLRNLDEILKH